MIPSPHPAMKSQGIYSGQRIGEKGIEHVSQSFANVKGLLNQPVGKTGRRYIAPMMSIPNSIGTTLGL